LCILAHGSRLTRRNLMALPASSLMYHVFMTSVGDTG
jgi:hypothetical protein